MHVYSYNYGSVRRSAPSGNFLPRDLWNIGIVDRLFQHIKAVIGSNRKTFGMFGNSAGAQYVLRYLALTEARSVGMAVCCNSDWYMVRDLSVDYPAGIGGLAPDEARLRKYFARHLLIILGDEDTDGAAPDLARDQAAMHKGRIAWRVGCGTSNTVKLLPDGSGLAWLGSSKPCQALATMTKNSMIPPQQCSLSDVWH